MDPIEVGFFYRSYVRRKKFEAELMANAVIGLLSQAMGGKAATPSAPAASQSEFQPRQKPQQQPTATPEAMPDRQVVPAYQFFKILESR